jgi:hypothetical protein
MMKRQGGRAKVTSMMQAYEMFCDKHLRAVPGWLAAEYLKMTPQGLYQAAERGWIAYFQHGRNRLYSYKDVVTYRHTASRKFKDNSGRPHGPGQAQFDFEVVPPAPPTKAEIKAAEKAECQALNDQALAALKGRGPWPYDRYSKREV